MRLSMMSAALVAALVGYGSSIAIVLAAFLWPETALELVGYTLCLLGYSVF